MADQLKVIYGLSNGAMLNDLERPQRLCSSAYGALQICL